MFIHVEMLHVQSEKWYDRTIVIGHGCELDDFELGNTVERCIHMGIQNQEGTTENFAFR